MLKFIYFLTSRLVNSVLDNDFPFSCSEYACKNYELTDSVCSILCMNPACNYDSSDKLTQNWTQRFQSSGCFSECQAKGCELSTLGITCNSSCNIPECGFGLGTCGFCASNCTKEMLLNNKCDPECNTRACMYDNNACGWCAPSCFKENLTSTSCMSNCSVPECNYQDLICGDEFCAPGCSPSMRSDMKCDPACNLEQCGYDSWRCACNKGCTDEKLYGDGKICYTECDNESCKYQNGVCGVCNSGCLPEMMGNNICDEACNVASCSYDYNDCTCAPGCNSVFDVNKEEWEWDLDEGGCKNKCLVEKCLFNYGACKNKSKIRAAWFQQLSLNDPSHILDLSQCYKNHPECTEEILGEIDQTGKCVEACNNEECLGCMGVSTGLACLRSLGPKCLVCLGSQQIYDHCFGSKIPPAGFSVVKELTDVFFEKEIYFRDPINYSPKNPFKIYVSQEGNDNNNGTAEYPLRSLSLALQLCTRTYNEIILTPGEHNFTAISPISPLIEDSNSPLKLTTDLFIKGITIKGSESSPTIIYPIEDTLNFNTQAQELKFVSLVFNGTYALSRFCHKKSCMYCPFLSLNNNQLKDDRNLVINNPNDYASNCSRFFTTDFISTSPGSKLSLISVSVVNFQQQLRTFISAQGSVELNNVNFTNVQNYKYNYFITISCEIYCTGKSFRYINGKVLNFNNGYEYSRFIILPGFISIEGLDSIKLQNVSFISPMIVTGTQVTAANYLISIRNLLGTVTIESCEFSEAFVNGILKIDSSTLSFDSLDVDKSLNIIQYASAHLFITSSRFQNINSIQCLICYSMGKVIQNIHIERSVFKNIAVNNKALIDISSIYPYNPFGEEGKWLQFQSNGKETTGWVQPHKFLILLTTFEDILYSSTLFYLSNQPNIELKQVKILKPKGFDLETMNQLILSTMINKTDLYIKKPLIDSSLSNAQCSNVIEITNSYSVIISDFIVKSVFCSGGTSVFSLNTAKSFKGLKINIDEINGDFKSELFYLAKITDILLNEFNFTKAIQSATSIIRVFDSDSLQLLKFSGQTLYTSYKSCLSLEKITKIEIGSFACYDCGSDYANGGALLIIPNTISSSILINEFNCEVCYSAKGLGGGINFDSYSLGSMHSLRLSNSRFLTCSALDGAAVYISSRVSLNPGEMNNIMIKNSTGLFGSVFADYHNQGLLNINSISFIDNGGYYSGLNTRYLKNGQMLSMTTVTILNPTGLFSVFNFDNVADQASASFSSVNVTSSSTLFITANSIILSLQNVSIDSGEGIFLENSLLRAIHFTCNGLRGHAIRSSNSTFSCFNCKFENSNAGPVIYVENQSILQINNSVFSNISSLEQGIVLYMIGCLGLNILENSVFTGGSSLKAALFELIESSLTINNCKITKNKSLGVTSGISLITSKLFINNSTLKDQESKFGGFLYIYASSSVEVFNTSFDQGVANIGGSVYSILSTFKASLCNFTNNINSISEGTGGALYGITSSNFTIDSCIFSNNFSPFLGSNIDFSGAMLKINNSDFYTSKATSTMISLDSVGSFIFTHSNMISVNTQGILSKFTTNLEISNSTFTNLSGAVSALTSRSTESTLYTISNCKFHNNSVSTKGGALDLSGASVAITSSLFSNNSAETGGAIHYECPGSYCNFSINDTNFQYNKAIQEGGAIKWSDNKPMDFNVIFFNNSASYGNDYASFAAILGVSSKQRSMKSLECAPGQPCKAPITLELQDSSGNTMTLDNTSTAEITISNNNYSISGNYKETSNKGVFTFLDYIIFGKPGSKVNISISTSNIDLSKANQVGDVKTYIASVTVLIHLRECGIGEQISENACSPCGANSYLFDPGASCNYCPVGGNCTGGWRIYVKPGYWKPDKMSDVVYSCPNSAACLGSVHDEDFMGSCEKGYVGNKCFGCENGYSRVDNNKCASCPDEKSNVSILVGVLLVFILQAVVLTITTIKSGYSDTALYSIYLKIFTNYNQLIILITQLDLEWPWALIKLFSAQKSVNTVSDQLYSLECYMQSNDLRYSSIFFAKLLVMAMLPIILWSISFLVWIIVCLIRKKWEYLKKDYFTTMIVLFFLIYPYMVSTMFSIFSCVYISETGYWIASNLQIKCWDSDHSKNQLTVAVPSIIIWVIGTPAIVLLLLHKNRKRFHEVQVKVTYGFFFKGYKKSTYYWEFVIMYRKILVICVIVFLEQISKEVQALTLVILLIVSLYLQSIVRPYDLNQCNHMETEGVLTATVTIYCGLYFLSNNTGFEVSITLLLIIMIANIYFLSYWLICMLRAILDLLSQSFHWARVLTHRTEIYSEHVLSEKSARQGATISGNENSKEYSLFTKYIEKSKLIRLRKIKKFKKLKQRAFSGYANKLLKKQQLVKDRSYSIIDENIENKFDDSELDEEASNNSQGHDFEEAKDEIQDFSPSSSV